MTLKSGCRGGESWFYGEKFYLCVVYYDFVVGDTLDKDATKRDFQRFLTREMKRAYDRLGMFAKTMALLSIGGSGRWQLAKGALCFAMMMVAVGCGNRHSFDAGTIAFGTEVKTESARAAVDSQSDLCEACSSGGEAIGIIGMVSDAQNPTPVDIFANDRLYFTGSEWTYDNPRYWVRGAQHEFLAIYPHAEGTYTWDCATGTLTYPDITLGTANNIDVMYAIAERNLATSTDTTSPVELELNHAFALLEFWFVNASTNTVSSVSDITIENLRYKGELTLSSDGTANLAVADDRVAAQSKVYVGNLTDTNLPVNLSVCYNLFDNVGTVGSSEFDSAAQMTRKNGGAVLVMPQVIEGAGVEFELRISGGNLSSFDLSQMSSVTEWKAGYKYIYTLTLTTSQITFDVKVLNWIEDHVDLSQKD